LNSDFVQAWQDHSLRRFCLDGSDFSLVVHTAVPHLDFRPPWFQFHHAGFVQQILDFQSHLRFVAKDDGGIDGLLQGSR
jgi:hypothetical protein